MNVIPVSPCQADGLSVSLVVYRPDFAQLKQTLDSLVVACSRLRNVAPGGRIELFLVDNGGLGNVHSLIRRLDAEGISCRVLTGHGNVGYGRGHNLAIECSVSLFHLIVNPDVELDEQAFVIAREFFGAHPGVGLITPRIDEAEGGLQYLCRRFPTLLDLFVRGFAPRSVQWLFAQRLARYEMRDVINERDIVWDPPIVSGCFMLFRTDVLKKLRGFDARYFLYFEDYDLSLRTHDAARVAYVPAVRVLHHGGGASRKGFAHIRMFAASAFKFFNRFGWRWL